MAFVYRLIFEISVYYALTGVYLQRYLSIEPSAAGMLLLCLAVILFGLLAVKEWNEALQKCMLLIPLAVLLFRPGVGGLLHLLPVWVYTGACLFSQRADTDYTIFKRRFSRSMFIFVLMALPLLNCPNTVQILENVTIYLLLYILSGVACLRSLRDKSNGVRQLVIVLAVASLCAVLTVIGVPQFLLKCLNQYVLQTVLRGLALLSMLIAYCVFECFKWLLSINGTPPDILDSGKAMSATAEIIGVEESVLMSDAGGMFWVEIIVYILLAVAIVIAAILLVRQLLKSGMYLRRAEQSLAWTDESVYLQRDKSPRKRSRRRPQDPRSAIRYYYSKYMDACGKRGIEPRLDWTSQDYSDAGKGCFENQDVAEITMLYRPARYCHNDPVTQQQVRQAAKRWQNIKKTKLL